MLLALLATGCYQSEYERLDELKERVDELTLFCDQLNSELTALKRLVEAIEDQDLITGVTEIKSGSTVTGYKLNFAHRDPITINNGADGKTPLVASRQNPDDGNYYWTVQYGSDSWDWLRAADGSMMLSIGLLPYIANRNGIFYYTVDGKNWVELGVANGKNGDQMFASIDTWHPFYILVTLNTGEVLKIPTYEAYESLKDNYSKVNENSAAQLALVKTTLDQISWITSIEPVLSGTDTTGLRVTLNDDRRFTLNDWIAKLTPKIFIKQFTDGKYYWAYSIGDGREQWVYNEQGFRIPATSDSVEVPQVSIARDTDGEYYWTVTIGGKTEFLRFKVSNEWTPHAIDSVDRVFSSVKNYTDSLVVVLKDGGTKFVLPKQYTVDITDPSGNRVDGTLAMPEVGGGAEMLLRYNAYGANATVSFITQGGVTATRDDSGGGTGFRVKAPSSIYDNCKVVAIFTFAGDSPVSVIKTIRIVAKED